MRSLFVAATAALWCTAVSAAAGEEGPSTTASTAKALYQPRMISAREATQDIALLRRALETIHPGLYRYTDKAGIDAAFAQAERVAAKPVSELALHAAIARMLATIHCDHSKAESSAALGQFRRANPTHLPFRFQLIEGRMILVSNDGQQGAPPPGSEILAINGLAVPPLLLGLSALVSYDGSTEQAIAAKLADDSDLTGDDFNENYPMLHGFPETWEILWKPVGEQVQMTARLAPISFSSWTGLASPGPRYRGEFYSSIGWRTSGKLAQLKIDTFVNYRNPVQPSVFLGGFFGQMQSAGTEHLILDLRNNGGGSENVAVALGRYLIDGPFLWAKPLRYKAVRYGDLQVHLESWGDTAARFAPPLSDFEQTADGWFDRTPRMRGSAISDDDITLLQQPRKTDRFRGRLTILSGPRIGSATTRTIAHLKEKAGATVVGEDSSGSAEGPTAGNIFVLKLPASGVRVRIPDAWNRTAIRSWAPGKGVPVDELVVPTLADFEAGRDRAVDVAKGLAPPAANVSALVVSALSGRWTGTLDYRDYGNDSRTTLPTILVSDGQTLDWVFDDGPGKTVRSSERWQVDDAGRSLTIAGGGKPETWQVAEARASETGDRATLVLEGSATENGRTVMARKILTREKARLRITKMTRAAGEPFLMRQSYELRR